MRDYCVYMLLCDDASFYIGVTNNVERRVWEHNEGGDPRCYTFTRRPVVLVHSAIFGDPGSAIQYEKKLKGWSRKKKQALIEGDYDRIRNLAKSPRRFGKLSGPSTTPHRNECDAGSG